MSMYTYETFESRFRKYSDFSTDSHASRARQVARLCGAGLSNRAAVAAAAESKVQSASRKHHQHQIHHFHHHKTCFQYQHKCKHNFDNSNVPLFIHLPFTLASSITSSTTNHMAGCGGFGYQSASSFALLGFGQQSTL